MTLCHCSIIQYTTFYPTIRVLLGKPPVLLRSLPIVSINIVAVHVARKVGRRVVRAAHRPWHLVTFCSTIPGSEENRSDYDGNSSDPVILILTVKTSPLYLDQPSELQHQLEKSCPMSGLLNLLIYLR